MYRLSVSVNSPTNGILPFMKVFVNYLPGRFAGCKSRICKRGDNDGYCGVSDAIKAKCLSTSSLMY